MVFISCQRFEPIVELFDLSLYKRIPRGYRHSACHQCFSDRLEMMVHTPVSSIFWQHLGGAFRKGRGDLRFAYDYPIDITRGFCVSYLAEIIETRPLTHSHLLVQSAQQ